MAHTIFISYAKADTDIIENLRDHLGRFGVIAWVYSLDRTLAENTWGEIEEKIRSSDMMLFAVSQSSESAEGQSRELEIALDKIQKVRGQNRVFPVVLRDTSFSALPDRLKCVNGERLDAYNVKTVAWKLAKKICPEKLDEEVSRNWRFPVPGDWLQISELDSTIEEFFDIGDKLYFRAISPIGLFECYAPKLESLFWIAPTHLRRSLDREQDQNLEAFIPSEYRIDGMVTIYGLGWGEWRRRQN